MGLTGVVLEATLRALPVRTAWMSCDVTRVDDLDALLAALCQADRRQYSVGWVDCLSGGRHTGRGVVSAADHAGPEDVARWRSARRGAVPADPDPDPRPRVGSPRWAPAALLNRWSVAAFNEAWYRAAPRRRVGVPQAPARFFHPLDGVEGWNRLYGRSGLVQYQCVVPDTKTVECLLALVRRSHAPALLAVLKRLGQGNPGPLSFPRPGWTLALDLPAGAEAVPRLLDALDETVAGVGGSVYLAKDSRMSPERMPTFYPRLQQWLELRERVDPQRRWQSDLSRRLAL
jgi:decaprenylphospho-beta-D-ribofuranose 2-oxidase